MYNDIMNPDVVEQINKIENEIQDELEKDEIDKEKIFKLRQKQLMAGLALNTGFIRVNKLY